MTLFRLAVTEKTQAADARRTAANMCSDLGFDDTLAGKVAIAVTEAGNNLATHANAGELLLASVTDFRGAALEMLSIDHGPGMDVDKCLQDGYSSAGTSGTGLGAIRRLANDFDIWSDVRGSVVYGRFSREEKSSRFLIGCARAAMHSETACGDDWAFRETPQGVALLVADGLGHGQLAADAARDAVRAFLHPAWRGAVDSVEALHAALRGSRGASIGITDVNADEQALSFAGLGNIAASVFQPAKIQRMVSHNGTAGHNAARIAGFQYAWDASSVLIMHSDGLTSHWTLEGYPGLLRCHPAVVAGVLYRDHSRGRDDVVVVVLKQVAL